MQNCCYLIPLHNTVNIQKLDPKNRTQFENRNKIDIRTENRKDGYSNRLQFLNV
jgi:hypothetical protein